MLRQVWILTIIMLISCGHGIKSNKSFDDKTDDELISRRENIVGNALRFINGYVENSNKLNQAVDIVDWVNSNELTTKSFKAELKKIIDDARRQDPELGLDADPIFDAQDYPEKGFELESLDEETNYLTVKGKDWPEFKLTMKMTEENGNWLVDGCGIVNVPEDKRAKR